jgi:fatty acid desaturase/predicted heme/steroid binding protein
MEPPKAVAKAGKTIKFEEFCKHNVESDCWMAVRGRVYDVTSWIPKHPGGVDTITLNGGRDATQIFESYHPIKAFPVLEKYYIGELDHSEYPQFPPMSKFYLTLKKKIEEHFESKKITAKYAPEMLLRSVFLVSVLLSFHYLSVVSSSMITSILCAVVVGIAAALICFMPVHEGSHAATTDSPFMWRILGSVHDIVNGASFYNWCHQHFLGHHPFTNVTEEGKLFDAVDPDVVTNDPDMRRIKPSQPYYGHYKYQKFYAPMLYGLLGIKSRLSDFLILFVSKKNGPVRVNPMNAWHTAIFFGGKAFFVYYRLILPTYYISFSKTLLLFFVADLVMSWILAFVFQVNHIIELAKWPKVDKETNMVNMDWAEMQIATTLDYAHGDWLTTFMTGALNYQVTHHLFPYVSQIHYPDIAPIIRAHCKEYGITYHHLPTFTDAFKAHIDYLGKMGAHYDF